MTCFLVAPLLLDASPASSSFLILPFFLVSSWSTRVILTRENTVIQSQCTIARVLITRILYPNTVFIRCNYVNKIELTDN